MIPDSMEDEDMVEELTSHARRALTDWEENFLDSMRDLIDDGGDLNDTQRAKLEEIYEDKA